MFGNKVYELTLVKDYVAHWGLAEAVRELVQNALDSHAPFVFSFSPGDGRLPGATFNLFSEGVELQPHHLMLGSTSKSADKDAIGSFGEGFKIALLVLTRMGYDICVYNGSKVWTPTFRMSRQYGRELLCVEERAAMRDEGGLRFVIEGLADEDVAAIRKSCLKMQPEVGEILPTSYGDILLDRPGELYVGSLFITNTEMKYGYNIKPEHVTLERDRKTVDSWDLRGKTTDMWYDTKRYEQIAQMIYDDVEDVGHARYNAPEMVKAAVFDLFSKNNPGAILAESPSELKKMIEQGLTKTVYVGGGVYGTMSGYGPYKDRLSQPGNRRQTPFEFCHSWLNAHRKTMSGLTAKHFEEQLLKASHGWKN